MPTFNGLGALRRHLVENVCIVTGRQVEGGKPAIVKVEDVSPISGEMMEVTINGIVGRRARAGMRDTQGRRVISVIRKGVQMEVKQNRNGIYYADCSISN